MAKKTEKQSKAPAKKRVRKPADKSTGKKASVSANSSASKSGSNKSSSGKPGSKPAKMRMIEKTGRKTKKFPRLRKWLKWLLVALIILAITPFILTVLYRAESVKPISTLMLGRYVTGQSVYREWRPFDDIASSLPQSVLMSEDGKFCSHNGVDWEALNLVIDDALEGEKTRGASTITMQLAKNLFLWSSRSFIRKGLELPLALWIDFVIPKRRIMEIYLNVVEWDIGVFGAQGAAQVYFKKNAAKLTRRQSALLAVTLPNPKRRNADKPTKSLRRLARIIEKRAKASGAYIKCFERPKPVKASNK